MDSIDRHGLCGSVAFHIVSLALHNGPALHLGLDLDKALASIKNEVAQLNLEHIKICIKMIFE